LNCWLEKYYRLIVVKSGNLNIIQSNPTLTQKFLAFSKMLFFLKPGFNFEDPPLLRLVSSEYANQCANGQHQYQKKPVLIKFHKPPVVNIKPYLLRQCIYAKCCSIVCQNSYPKLGIFEFLTAPASLPLSFQLLSLIFGTQVNNSYLLDYQLPPPVTRRLTEFFTDNECLFLLADVFQSSASLIREGPM